jgi:cell division septal protein FtsQ
MRRSPSRAERIRQRRQTRPPVTQRAERLFSPSRPRRPQRYEVFVGSFVRTPRRFALPSFSPGRVIHAAWLLSLLLLGLGIVYLLVATPYFRVERVQVLGVQRVSAAEVETVLDVRGRLLFTLAPRELEQTLLRAFPEFAAVQVHVQFPNGLEVQVREREPLIRWEQDGRYTWIDTEGIALRPRGEAAGLIRVRALTPPPPQPAPADPARPPAYLSPQMVEALRQVAAFLPADCQLLYDARYGFGWEDAQGRRVFFGQSAAEMPARMQVYLYLSRFLEQQGIHPAFIDLRYPDAPYYRLEAGDG